MDAKPIAAVFVVLSLIFGASTVYLLANPGGGTVTTTNTIVMTSTQTTTISAQSSLAFSVNIAYKPGIGFYLVNGSGMTLYYRTVDIQSNGTSTCTGACVQVWPVFYTTNLALPPGLNASSFRVVTRADGAKQLTYNGWPLYLYSGDAKPGEILGEGIGGVWFAYALSTPSQTATSTSTTSSVAVTTSSTTTAPATTSSTTSSTTTSMDSTSSTSTTSTTRSTSTHSYTY